MKPLPNLLRGGEPQFYRGNAIGCIVVHGFHASPNEVGWMGSHLAELGYTVYVPRLTGHGYDHRHMRRMNWEDWFGQVLDAYHIMTQQCEQVYLVGHSMGGLLSLLVSVRVPVDGVVVAASPLEVYDWRARFAHWIDYILPFTEYDTEPEFMAQVKAEQEKRAEAQLGRINYSTWSTRASHQFYVLMNTVIEYLPRVTAPLMLVYATNDEVAIVDNIRTIKNAVRSEIVEQHILHKGGHITFMDEGREEAFDVIADFIQRRVKAGIQEA